MNTIYKHEVHGVVRYIGETSKAPEVRLKEHWSESRNTNTRNHRLNLLRSLDEPPVVGVLEIVPAELAEERERYWIALARDYGCRLVNGTDGGIGGPMWGEINGMFGKKHGPETIEKMRLRKLGKTKSEETREKMRVARLGDKNPFFGKQHSSETIEANRQAQTGKVFSPERLEKMRIAHLGEKNHFFGKTHSSTTLEKISAAGNKRNPLGLPGVSFNKSKQKYQAYAGPNGRRIWLGSFLTAAEACAAREKYIAERGVTNV